MIKRIHKPEKNSYLDKDITWNNEYSYYIITYIGKHKSLYRDMYESISTKHEHVYEEIKKADSLGLKVDAASFDFAAVVGVFSGGVISQEFFPYRPLFLVYLL